MAQPLSKVNLANNSGQIVVEYILLLVVGVGVAMLITSTMVNRNENNPGFLISKWVSIIRAIGDDTTDDLKPAGP